MRIKNEYTTCKSKVYVILLQRSTKIKIHEIHLCFLLLIRISPYSVSFRSTPNLCNICVRFVAQIPVLSRCTRFGLSSYTIHTLVQIRHIRLGWLAKRQKSKRCSELFSSVEAAEVDGKVASKVKGIRRAISKSGALREQFSRRPNNLIERKSQGRLVACLGTRESDLVLLWLKVARPGSRTIRYFEEMAGSPVGRGKSFFERSNSAPRFRFERVNQSGQVLRDRSIAARTSRIDAECCRKEER